jgi:4-alpha-glucanotransferase
MTFSIPTKSSKHWKKIGAHHHHGICVPLFFLKTHKSEGIGEYSDLLPLIDWCKSIGFDTIQLLPLNDTCQDSSPYNALSSFALHPVYLNLLSLPNFKKYLDLVKEVTSLIKLNNQKKIDYPLVANKKENILSLYLDREYANLIQNKDFSDFLLKEQSWLEPYGLFKSLKKVFPQAFWQWPKELRNFTSARQHSLSKGLDKHIKKEFLKQFFCFQQLKMAKDHATENNILLKGDLPILIRKDSSDVWNAPYLFNTKLDVGSPPDQYSPEGQNWGFPLYNWKEHFNNNYSWWKHRLRLAENFYHLFRMDHIAGLFRLWTIPKGEKPHKGFYLPKKEEEWEILGNQILNKFLDISDLLPIGEDLGTVPPCTRDTMKTLGICGTKVVRWEQDWEKKEFIPLKDYPLLSLTCLSTHDSETLAQWWKNSPEESKQFANLYFIDWKPSLCKETRLSLLKLSHESNSLFHINLLSEYLALFPELSRDNPKDERINIPGTISKENWTCRMKTPLEELTKHNDLHNLMTTLCNQHHATCS